MTQYTDAFSNGLKPPSEQGLTTFNINGEIQTQWPASDADAPYPLANIVEVTCTQDSVMRLPPADAVSPGASCLVVNKGVNTLATRDFAGNYLTDVVAGTAFLFYVVNNATPAGTWGQLAYGSVIAAVSAGAIAGLGTKATGSTLSVATPVVSSSSDGSLQNTHRGATLEFTGGVAELLLDYASVYGPDFYCFVKNSGYGTVTLVPKAGELIDKSASAALQPNESLILIVAAEGSFITVGQGRSTVYQFSSLTLDVSAGGTFTLSAAQASNKMLTFVGNPAAGVVVVVPGTVSIYYAANNLSTAYAVTVKVASGTGSIVGQSQRAVLLCDGTNVTSAQTAPLNVTGVVAPTNGGTGQSSYTVGDLIYASGAAALSKLAAVATGNVLLSGGTATAPTWGKVNLTSHVSGILPLANGGTGVATLTGVAYGNGTGVMTAATAAQLVAAIGATAVANAANGGVTSVNGQTGAITAAQIADAATAGYGYTPANSTHTHNMTHGAVGSLCFARLFPTSGGTISLAAGATVAGSELVPAGGKVSGTTHTFESSGSALSGTWRCLGYAYAAKGSFGGLDIYGFCLFQRIS